MSAAVNRRRVVLVNLTTLSNRFSFYRHGFVPVVGTTMHPCGWVCVSISAI